MSADAITIERCTLRIVRRGGWSWGSNPRGLLDAAVRALPWLIAREILRLTEQNAEGEIGEPVRLTVRTSEEAIAAAAAMVTSGDTFCLERSALVLDVARVIRAHPTLRSVDSLAPAENELAAPLVQADGHSSRLRPIAVRLLEWLRRRHEEGELGRVLNRVPPDVLDAWHRWLFPRSDDADVSSPELDAAAGALAGLLSAGSSSDTTGLPPDAVKRRRLAAAVRAAAELELDPIQEAVQTAICRLIPLAESSAGTDLAPDALSRGGTERAARRPWTAPRSRTSSPRQAIDLDNLCALPFLQLGPLHRIGYPDAAALALSEGVLPTFAAGLAMKVLSPPSHGWLRDSRTASTAAVFAGLDSHVADTAFHELTSAGGSAALELLDDVVARELRQGHAAGTPVILAAMPDEALIVDLDGAFVIAASDAVGVVAGALKEMSGQWIAVLADTASADLMAALRDAGVAVVTDARPGRRDRWSRVPRWRNAERSWWTTSQVPPPVAMLARLESEAELVERARALWQALRDRPAIPRCHASALERSLSVASAFALGTIAWTLWRDREPVDPLLALERFATLDARVAVKDDQVCVRLPLGTRYLDLKNHGLLADVPDVAWLGGRTVVFSGG